MLGLSLAVLQPDFTWSVKPLLLAITTPSTPQPTWWLLSRFWGHVHRYLRKFSKFYCRWYDVPWNPTNCDLPFGLILKWADGTRVEEALSMQFARAAGLPVPKLICYGEHPNDKRAPASILMTRMPGDTLLQELWEWYLPKEQATMLYELQTYLRTLRSLINPWQPTSRICSIIGTSIRGHRIPHHMVGPCVDEAEFNEFMIRPAWLGDTRAVPEFDEKIEKINKLHSIQHNIVFTHGDFVPWNILIDDGHITAILDWEAAGWLPEYWEYVTAKRMQRPTSWWYGFVGRLANGQYTEEYGQDLAVQHLTQGYWIG